MSARVAIVGRPNVGKSTLFNCLVGGRDALVANVPGLTRDRRYGRVRVDESYFVLIDTAGLSEEKTDIQTAMSEQSWLVVEEADLVLFLLDARDGRTVDDELIADRLRRSGKKQLLVLNKVDGMNTSTVAVDFYNLITSHKPIIPISASNRRGLANLLENITAELPKIDPVSSTDEVQSAGIKIAIIGRPNTGKSTLLNRLLGTNRVLVSSIAGTTRDSVSVPFKYGNQDYTLIDTAGVRRRGKVQGIEEKFSVSKTLAAIDSSQIVLLMLDATESLVSQDLHILSYALETHKAPVLLVNKWDTLDKEQKFAFKNTLDRRLQFMSDIETCFISALQGFGIRQMFISVKKLAAVADLKVSTNKINNILGTLIKANPPPKPGRHQIKLRYAHLGSTSPLTIIIHGNQAKALPANYKLYLQNGFRKKLNLPSIPLQILLRDSINPYAGKKNRLNDRQIRKRKRLIRHNKRK